ncbi:MULTISPECIES: diacylglycerol/lipid kinase family protein [Roseomonadaceae]|uniref:Diacylglycerol kinase family lipid kinase n=1 Tax=Falsiroseomonas oleicola TaxID=2801474 RepID=A0ABS6HH96_9PROT|nr:diacylglycerol kinase family protein [Roseomonas oleicola]MBU8547107.1 diacylglycerol kinase family lipid kinase [Roseomonas oleicola]
MLIVFNPTAGAGRRRRLSRALDALLRLGLRPEVAETAGPGDARRIAAAAAARGIMLVVAAGGDGTIAEVAAGLSGSPAALGLLPLGTANVLAWELGLNRTPEAAAQVLAQGKSGLVWPGHARFADGREILFVQMLGAGFDAAVVAALDLRLKRQFGRAAYVLQALREAPRYGYPPITASLDGGVAEVAASVIVTKGRLYAGRHLLAPAARPAAPGFQVVLFRQGGAAAALLAGAALPLGLVPRLPGVVIRPARQVVLTGAAVPVQADGDPAGLLPVSVEDGATPLRILLP